MTPDSILSHTPISLSQNERRQFFDDGYLKLEAFVKNDVLGDLQSATGELVSRSSELSQSNPHYELADDHTIEQPHPVVMKMVADLHPTIWNYVSSPQLTDLAVDLLGPDVKFRESYINFKKAGVGRKASWHQDFPFFPVTNRAMITVLTYLDDVTEEMGPIRLVPGTHRGPLYDHYDENGWIGRLPDDVVAGLTLEHAISLPGPAGTVVVFDNFMVHGSNANRSRQSRPVMVTGYAAADALPYTSTTPSMYSPRTWQLLRGQPAAFAHHEPIKVRVPPDWAHQEYIPPDWPERDLVSRPGYHPSDKI